MSDEPITAQELHEHIQATIFGKAAKKDAARFDELQEKLHEIVDWYFAAEFVGQFDLDQIKLEAIRAFVERVERQWQFNGEWPQRYRLVVLDELAAMEAEVKGMTEINQSCAGTIIPDPRNPQRAYCPDCGGEVFFPESRERKRPAPAVKRELEAIRAFVEQVCRKRFYEYPPSTELESAGFYFDCIDELAAMEKENEPGA